MLHKEIIEKVKGELDIPADKFAGYAADAEVLMEYLDQKNVLFKEDNELAFLAHIVTLLIRLETGERVQGMGEEILAQIDREALAITSEFMSVIEKKYTKADTAEVILAAIHIQTAMEIMEES